MDYEAMFSSLKKNNEEKICKVCGGANISCFAHTARCLNCNVLLNFPYVEPREIDFIQRKVSSVEYNKAQKISLSWHIESGVKNHHNFGVVFARSLFGVIWKWKYWTMVVEVDNLL